MDRQHLYLILMDSRIFGVYAPYRKIYHPSTWQDLPRRQDFPEEEVFDFEMYSNEERKWYEHDKEMIELSKQFPETVFCLYGNGEENGDTWYKYYKNGKSQYCPAKITYDEYDESKLA